MMNLYQHELRQLRSSFLVWSVALSLISLLFLMLYPAFSDDLATSRALLERFPPALRDAFGLNLDTFFTFLGFYAYTFTYIALAGAAHAMSLGLGVMTRENRSKTTDFLLTKPITRRRAYLAKLAAALTILGATFIVYCLVSGALCVIVGVGEFDVGKCMVMNLVLLGLELWFLALGAFVSQIAHKIRSTSAHTLSFVFGLFIIGVLGALISEEAVRYLTPFKYVDYLAYAANGTIDARYVAVGATLMAAMFVASFLLYVKRDKKAAI